MTENETEMTLTLWGADLLVLRVCVVQMLIDRMRQQDYPDSALRAFADGTTKLMAAVTTNDASTGADVQMIAVERLDKLIDTVRALLSLKR